ncbi:MAG: hypothetical protein AMS18_03595 [Gemmatimonas sp. SG8_17]|nr:MAG: hypothetical protein AMS18_03595 [Gemmatimonas sp. SG8_17]
MDASPAAIIRHVSFHGFTLVAAGLTAGVFGSLFATRLVRSAIAELGDLNVSALIAAASVLGAVAAVATHIPVIVRSGAIRWGAESRTAGHFHWTQTNAPMGCEMSSAGFLASRSFSFISPNRLELSE